MAANSSERNRSERSPERRAAEEEVRRRFQSEPGLRALRDRGEIDPETYERARQRRAAGPPDDPFRRLVATLRSERERQGLSLADVAARSGLDRAAIHKLEIGLNQNPTVATLARYADALGVRITWAVEPSPPEEMATVR
jgi:ribosome-binding protein aMBF1 (putative translation factor)